MAKGYKRCEGTRAFWFKSNQKLANKIIDISNKRLRSLSSTIRMLLWIGLEQHEINELSGNDTAVKRQQAANLKKAQAEAEAALRTLKRGKKSGTSPAITVILAGSDEARELFGGDE